MRLELSDPRYTERLASFLRSLGQAATVSGPRHVELEVERAEAEIYLRVWRVLNPDADVHVVDQDDLSTS